VQVVVVLQAAVAYPTGCDFQLKVFARRLDHQSNDEWWDFHEAILGHKGRVGPDLPSGRLRIGVEFADGRRVTNFGPAPRDGDRHVGASPPDGPVLVERGGSANWNDWELSIDRSIWLWPLPESAPFDLVIEWPQANIALSRTSVDGASISAAATMAEPLWQELETET
jgi:hypothetical protein